MPRSPDTAGALEACGTFCGTPSLRLVTSELLIIRNERQAHNGIEGPALPSPTQRIIVGPSRSIQLPRLIQLWLHLQSC